MALISDVMPDVNNDAFTQIRIMSSDIPNAFLVVPNILAKLRALVVIASKVLVVVRCSSFSGVDRNYRLVTVTGCLIARKFGGVFQALVHKQKGPFRPLVGSEDNS
ncbi:MAG: hypothetical protein RL710_2211 [Pseudomonadota bacterium]